jgi:hypothetical protein
MPIRAPTTPPANSHWRDIRRRTRMLIATAEALRTIFSEVQFGG